MMRLSSALPPSVPRTRLPLAPHACSSIPPTPNFRRARLLRAASEWTRRIPTGKVDVEGFRHHDHGEREHPAAFLEMPTHRQFGVAEGDVGVDHAVDDEPGDREDVEWPFTLDEGIPRRHFRGLHDVKVIAIERTDTGKDRGVPDPL